jgi:ABC-type branched-subunit amino acid transport system ATPase component
MGAIDATTRVGDAAPGRPTTGGSALAIAGLDASYGPVQALFGFTLDLKAGEILVVIGPNGAGKTTMLRTICGLHPMQAGTVRLGDLDIGHLPTERRVAAGLGVMFGGEAVFGDLTVEGNLRAGGDLLRRDPALLQERIDAAFEVFPRLAERRKALAVQLSGGEQQMLGLAKSFLLKPSVLCIDELSLGLAPPVIERLLDVLRSIRGAGTSLLLVEQSTVTALAVADRIAFVERGEVRYVGSASEVREQPERLHELFVGGQA